MRKVIATLAVAASALVFTPSPAQAALSRCEAFKTYAPNGATDAGSAICWQGSGQIYVRIVCAANKTTTATSYYIGPRVGQDNPSIKHCPTNKPHIRAVGWIHVVSYG